MADSIVVSTPATDSTVISSSTQGATGATGSQGIQGIQGLKGNTGDIGLTGTTGSQGIKGDTGNAGVGVVVGGTAGQVLTKIDSTNYNTIWSTPTGAVSSVAGKTGIVTLTSSDVGLNNVANTAQVTAVSGTAPIVSSGGTTPSISISAATTSAAGSLSSTDKTKLDSITVANLIVKDGSNVVTLPDAAIIKWTSDLALYRDAANIFAQRNGTAAQEFRLYNTYSSVSDYERAVFDWTTVANTLTLGTEAGGTGIKRLLSINALTSITGTTASDLPTYSAELIAGPVVGWGLGTGWTGDNTAGFVRVASTSTNLTYTLAGVSGTKYFITFTCTRTSGSGNLNITFGGITSPVVYQTATWFPIASSSATLVINPDAAFAGTIKVSIKAYLTISSPIFTLKNSSGTVYSEMRTGGDVGSTFIGVGAGRYNTGAGNVGIGNESFVQNTTGSYNVGIGSGILGLNSMGSQNVVIGTNCLAVNTYGSTNVAVGHYTLYTNTTGGNNTALGYNALLANTTGSSNSTLGANTLKANTTGSYNVAIGDQALQANFTASNNVGIGKFAAFNNTTGVGIIAIGDSTLFVSTINNDIVTLGAGNLGAHTLGSYNSAIGSNSLTNMTGVVGSFGTRVNGSGYTTDGTYNNVQLTYVSGSAVAQGGTYPTANITVSGGAVTACVLVNTGTKIKDNTTVLSCLPASLSSTTPTTAFTIAINTTISSAQNLAVGYQSGKFLADGTTAFKVANNSTYLGVNTKASADNITNETVIGYNAIGSGSNTTTIGSSATLATKVFGVKATGQVATTLASAATIAPTLPIHFVSGTTTIDTITPPTGITGTGGQITLIPTAVFSLSTAGNVALPSTAVISRALTLTYDATTTKWYPSY